MKKKSDKIPVFKNEGQEMDFWATHDSAEIIDWSMAEKVVLPNLKPSTRTISLRLPDHMLDALKVIAHKRDIPYQSLIKIYLKEMVDREFSQLHR